MLGKAHCLETTLKNHNDSKETLPKNNVENHGAW
jgi:hypothetical protein